jgi:hypothetical protein
MNTHTYTPNNKNIQKRKSILFEYGHLRIARIEHREKAGVELNTTFCIAAI